MIHQPKLIDGIWWNWENVFMDGGHRREFFFDANGLDVWFDFPGSLWAFGTGTESQGVRIVTLQWRLPIGKWN
jgi:hypothetical protein